MLHLAHGAQDYTPHPQIAATYGSIQGYPELIWASFCTQGVWLGVVSGSITSFWNQATEFSEEEVIRAPKRPRKHKDP